MIDHIVPGKVSSVNISHVTILNEISPVRIDSRANTLMNGFITNIKNAFNSVETQRQGVNERLSTFTVADSENSFEPWNKKNIHLANTDEGLALWLRDVTIDQDNEMQVCQELHRRLNDLGIRLSKIYLNGRLIGNFSPAEPII